ncbi:MAG: hypothetical protein GTN89_13555 [Acidobacteria bacterium]|nr:hypothetical protein [Acidobacteriota bacterium]NIM60377.1 hypothetical protein [Acidobacteriota bacterium]NIO60312.1 hypothetical protein [Acidobacteriota bacterium]NIQ31367.1 hypothetical protein [Acidobacteriota bacterium]NIQ86590.1 hypothetical protein [Acidobacteriota bacterium]
MRLGEALVHKGFITEDQLQQTLKAQLIYGGHLGTCLLEFGYVNESQLGRVLAETFEVGYASIEMFQDINPAIIDTISRKVVERCHVIPFGLDDKVLQVAMIDPRSVTALDEIAAFTHYKVVPWVAPEARIYQAMERYYNIPRRQRYIMVCRDLDLETSAGREQPRRQYATGDPPWQSNLGEISAELEDRRLDDPSAEPEPDAGVDPIHDLDQVSKTLCEAQKMESVTSTILNYASRTMARCILFAVKANEAHVLDSRGFPSIEEGGEPPSFPVGPQGIFGLTLGREDYRGSVPDEPSFKAFYQTLGVDVPAEILVFPLYLDDRLVAVLYGEAGGGLMLDPDNEEYLRLAKMVTLSMSLVVIKKKILAA